MRAYGCGGAADEAAVTRTHAVLYRDAMQLLEASTLERARTRGGGGGGGDGDGPVRVLVDGPSGSGKSVAIAHLVQRARRAGWCGHQDSAGGGWRGIGKGDCAPRAAHVALQLVRLVPATPRAGSEGRG
eukprot:349604-Chlamydomonas_euryale.AAC.12